MKQEDQVPVCGIAQVAPSRGRGLKRPAVGIPGEQHRRPFTGAWIETSSRLAGISVTLSRPFTGAWIETRAAARSRQSVVVAPSRGRGLKPWAMPRAARARSRPFTGAWIETVNFGAIRVGITVAPSRGRGLKPAPGRAGRYRPGVAPSRGRGLKPRGCRRYGRPAGSPLHGGVD